MQSAEGCSRCWTCVHRLGRALRDHTRPGDAPKRPARPYLRPGGGGDGGGATAQRWPWSPKRACQNAAKCRQWATVVTAGYTGSCWGDAGLHQRRPMASRGMHEHESRGRKAGYVLCPCTFQPVCSTRHVALTCMVRTDVKAFSTGCTLTANDPRQHPWGVRKAACEACRTWLARCSPPGGPP